MKVSSSAVLWWAVLSWLNGGITVNGFFIPAPASPATRSSRHSNRSFEKTPTATSSFTHGKATQLAAVSGEDVVANPMFQYFMQSVINYAVPSFFTILTFGFAAFFFKKSKEGSDDDFAMGRNNNAISELYNDLYGETKQGSGNNKFNNPFSSPGNKGSPNRNLGIPSAEYIKVTNLNEKYDSYDFSLTQATKSKAVAAAQFRNKAFDRALQLALSVGQEIPAYAKSQLLEAEKKFVKQGVKISSTIQSLEGQLIKERLDTEFEKMDVKNFLDPEPVKENVTAATNETTTTATTSKSKANKSKLTQEISKLKAELNELELTFIQEAVSCLGPERAAGVRTALLGDVAARGAGGLLTQLQDRPLSTLLRGSGEEADKKSLFVMKFPGDVTASQLNELREEVTAIVRNAKPGDEALVVLQSGGGTVTGYGLAAGQLVRLKEKGLFLTIAVEQVAASGGYMMTCVADRIIASPFAVLGSIGVISEIPNAYERLKKEGIEFQTVTAGEFKRTLTPTKKVTREDFAKAKDDVEMILTQFRDFVHQNRPSLNIDKVATGETWFGQAALEKGLCDEIKPVDDILLNYVDLGYNVYEIAYEPPPEKPLGLAGLIPATSSNNDEDLSLGRRMIRWLVTNVASEVKSAIKAEVESSGNVEKRYMARDDAADRIQIKDHFF